ncbi:hypothetical protein ACHAPT_000530 [Fusarium lateritium]
MATPMEQQQMPPPPKPQPANLLNLPADILVQILDYFRDHDIIYEDRVHWDRWYGQSPNKTICKLRLTCRRLHDLASPFLCPVVEVDIDKSSLSRVEGLLSNRHIASGVVGLCVTLEYRPAELAADLAKFVKVKDDALIGICNHPSQFEGLTMEFGRGSTASEGASAEQMFNRMVMRKAWDNCIASECDDEPDEQVLAYQNILRKSYKEYVRLHEEQLRLIEDGTFVNTLASLLPQGQQPLSLIIRGTKYDEEDDYVYDYYDIFDDPEDLPKFLIGPHAWATLDNLDGEVSLTQAKFVSELPIALHKAGVSLQFFQLSCPPVRSSFSAVCPGSDISPDAVAWQDLGAACQKLKGFELLGLGSAYHKTPQSVYMSSQDRALAEAYLGTVLSGQCLEKVEVDLGGFGLVDMASGRKEPCLLVGAFASTSWPRIKSLDIKGVAFTQQELERLCLGLSPSMTLLNLSMIDLWDGSRARTLDILRDKFGAELSRTG